jgi:hypothetical protein
MILISNGELFTEDICLAYVKFFANEVAQREVGSPRKYITVT